MALRLLGLCQGLLKIDLVLFMELMLFLCRCAQRPIGVLRIYGCKGGVVFCAQRGYGGTEVSHGLGLSLISGLVEPFACCSEWMERECGLAEIG